MLVGDLPDPLFLSAARTLEGYRTAYAHYHHLLEAQRHALRTGDFVVLSTLAEESAGLLGRIDEASRLPDELAGALDQAEGPQADQVRALLLTVQHEAESAQQGIRAFTADLEARRRTLMGTLESLGGPPAPPPPPG